MTTTEPTLDVDIDEQAAEKFAGRLFELFTGATLSCLIDIGRRTGLFDAAARGPATSDELANRASLQERYVREWLGAMATAGIFEYSRSTATYWLPREHAACLSGDRPENLSGVALLTTILAKHVPAVTDAFRHGGSAADEEVIDAMAVEDLRDAGKVWRLVRTVGHRPRPGVQLRGRLPPRRGTPAPPPWSPGAGRRW